MGIPRSWFPVSYRSSSFWLLASGFWLLASGFWRLASGFWLLASGFWLLASGFLSRRPSTSSVRLTEPIPAVRNAEGAVLLSGHFDPVCGAIVDRSRSGPGAGLGSRRCGNRHCRRLVIHSVGNEHPGHGVLLAAEQREVKLPQILETWR